MRRILTRLVFPLLAGGLLAGCVTTGGDLGPGAGEGVDPEAPIVPLIDVAERRTELAALSNLERRQWCLPALKATTIERKARITGPIEYQDSNAQRAGNALFALVEAYYAGNNPALPD